MNTPGDDITWLGEHLDHGDLSGQAQRDRLQAMVVKMQKQNHDLVALEKRLREGKEERARGLLGHGGSSRADQMLDKLEQRLEQRDALGLSDIKEEEEARDR